MTTALSSSQSVAALDMSCSTALGAGTAAASDPFWMESISHQGISAFNSDPSTYKVFRNVKDYGAKGDGLTDDIAAINAAISDGGRCGGGLCSSSTITPAVVYFPAGTYIVSTPIIPYYFTQLIGDGRKPPTLRATAGFSGIAVIDANPYGAGGVNWYVNQNNFFRSVRNFVIDLTQIPASTSATGLHWQVSQATSLINIVVNMSTASGNNHQGIFMENGSGGFMGDLIFNGGKFGIWVGNQQFTVRNITVNNAATGIYAMWNWGWTFQNVNINNCGIGFELDIGGTTKDAQGCEAEAIIDATVTNTPTFIRTTKPSIGSLTGSIVLSNIKLWNVPVAVGDAAGATLLSGGTTTIDIWAQGNVFTGKSGSKTYTQGSITPPNKASSLLDSAGQIVSKGHPQYADYAASQFVSARTEGCKGDGKTDDTVAIQALLNTYAGRKIVFFDAGTYLVTDTIRIPVGTQIVGEAWSVIMGSGSKFSDSKKPTVMVQVGAPGSAGVLEISDMIFKTQGPAGGAIIIEWNVHDPQGNQAAVGMWDSHVVLGGAVGTDLQSAQCPKGSTNTDCMAAFLGIHLTVGSSAYLEGTWVWTADHDLDGTGADLTIFAGRGIYSQSQGPVWLIGTAAEHFTLYQYNFVGAADHWIGLAQTETPYYQPSAYNDPVYPSSGARAWAMNIASSQNIVIFGGGFYNFFNNYDQTCLTTNTCQSQIVNVDSTSTAQFYSVSTVGVVHQLSVKGTGVIKSSDGRNGFAETYTAWTA
ncbi:glycoside hydrolase family 55 protein [Athelia psychrophila]|uniref:Glycoside hydrolase family 55 protein n=1 Tax=Athelia psychrophila TaxID=1759441 RepID=A0A167XDU1_9AGAM|nr:glycoside hydrolase family 55 protein [Fibularhizoctonia sp. CBS 109695]